MNTILRLPSFYKGVHYKELTPTEGKYKYRFVTTCDIKITLLHPILPRNHNLEFFDKFGRVWLRISNNQITISKDYAWDGCTPKKWCGIWWGSPDFEDTHLASLLHDALLQFRNTEHFPISRYEADRLFKNILKEDDFIFRGLYYIGVRIGSMFSSKKNNGTYSKLTIIPNY